MDGSRAALIIATGTYKDQHLRRLRSPAQDARALARVLSDPAIGNFAVQQLTDQTSYSISRAAERFFAQRGLQDLLLVHLSCHGIKDDQGRLFFAATDTEREWLASTAISAEFLHGLMERCRARAVVLLLDCCYSGAFFPRVKGDEGVHLKEKFEGRGRAVLTASNAIEYSWEGDKLSGKGRPSVFSAAIVEGLETGKADRDEDGAVSIDDLYKHVYERVREAKLGQTPLLWSFGIEGNLYVAQNPAFGKMLTGVSGAPARPAVQEPRESPPSGAAPKRKTQPHRWLLGGLGAALLVLGVVVGIVLTRPAASIKPSAATFRPAVLNGNLVVNRSWQLEGDTLTGQVDLTNAGDKPADLVYDEVVPKSVSRSAAALRRLEPQPQIVRDDPVLRFTFPQVPPHETRTVIYEVTVAEPGPDKQRLDRLMADQERTESEYVAAQHIDKSQLQSLAAAPSTLDLPAERTAAITLSGTMSDGTPAPPATLGAATWTSSSPEVAKVEGGTVRGITAGRAGITAVVGNLTASIPVNVTQPTVTPSPRMPKPTKAPSPVPPPSPSLALPPVAPPTPPTRVPPRSSPLPPSPPVPVRPPGPPMSTTDNAPCTGQFIEKESGTNHGAQRCPLIPGTIPVYDSPDQGNGARQVGTLVGGDSRNWFVGQVWRSNYVHGPDANHWWAFTLSDRDSQGNSHWGWVSETFFQGGANDERDEGLALCDTNGNACHP